MNQTQESVALAVVDEHRGLQMVTSPNEAKRRIQELQAFVQSVMVKKEDYGVIPGTGDKPTLLKPGAEKLAEVYGLAWRYEPLTAVENWEQGFFFYRYRCVVVSRSTGAPICEGLGSCNSRESKYAARWVGKRDVPEGMDLNTLKTRQRSGKYGEYTQYFVPTNDDIYSLVNTIEKMAAKRALVSAIIGATRSSGIFTQDIEDLPLSAFGPQPVVETTADTGAQKLYDQLVGDYAVAIDAQGLATLAAAVTAGKARFSKAQLATLRKAHKTATQRIAEQSAEREPGDDSDEPEAEQGDWVSATGG